MKKLTKNNYHPKKSGHQLSDYLNQKLTTNNFSNKFKETLESKAINQAWGPGLDFTGVFRNNRTYLQFIQSNNQTRSSQDGTGNDSSDLVVRSLSEQITPDMVYPGDGFNMSNSNWWKETSNWILRGNKNVTNNYDPVPCALVPVYDYANDTYTCGRYLEKVLDDGNSLITMSDWSTILCEELGDIYCTDNIATFDCNHFCHGNPEMSDIQDWYDDYYFYWYNQNISWSHAGWDDLYESTPSSQRSPVWSFYKMTGQSLGDHPNVNSWYLEEFIGDPFYGKNRICGHGVAAFPATSCLSGGCGNWTPEDIWSKMWGTWTTKHAKHVIFWCDADNLCGDCAPSGELCEVKNDRSYCRSCSTQEWNNGTCPGSANYDGSNGGNTSSEDYDNWGEGVRWGRNNWGADVQWGEQSEFPGTVE